MSEEVLKGEQQSSGIQRIKRDRKPRKPKVSQIPFALLLLIGTVIVGFVLANRVNTNVALGWVFGISFGYVLQRARFCFTAGFRDPIMTGGTSVTRAILVAFAIASIGWVAIRMGGDAPAGPGIAVSLAFGAVIFGIGMVIAGGCASGTLMRVGEGFTQLLLVLVFFIIGNFVGQLFLNNMPNFLGDILTFRVIEDSNLAYLLGGSWFWGLVVQFTIMLAVYIIAVKWQKKKLGSDE